MSSTFGYLRVGVIGIDLKATPELVSAGATAGLIFLDEAETIRPELELAPSRASGRRSS